MEHGQAGAEALVSVMRSALGPLINVVYEFDGFVATHGGDSFMAVFAQDPVLAGYVERALAAAVAISRRATDHAIFATPYGHSTITTEIGLGAGEVRWGIIESADCTLFCRRSDRRRGGR
jgi:class 3 adenylate cyclase